jgi:hypothetical protein
MKKAFLIVLILFVSLLSFAQGLVEKTSKSLTLAQKATTELEKIYNLSVEQAAEVLKIQNSKFEALSKLGGIKTKDIKKYIAKRVSTFETADNALMILLDTQQMVVFKQQQVEKSYKYDTLVGGMKKQGISEADIEKKLAETDF